MIFFFLFYSKNKRRIPYICYIIKHFSLQKIVSCCEEPQLFIKHSSLLLQSAKGRYTRENRMTRKRINLVHVPDVKRI